MITIKDLFFNYDRKQVLKDVTLEYEPGKIYYLLGPNGFGKSTLLRCIAGLHRIEQGSIWVNNENPFKRNINFLNDISFISEETYYPDMSINKFAALYGALYPRFSLQNFHEYLMMFEVEINQRISALSFGQKKKLHLAFAFAAGTNIILLDEPTNGIDINSKMQFRKILAVSASEDKTIIIGTHDVSDMNVMADGITVLGKQKVLFHQHTSDIIRRVSFGFTTNEDKATEALYYEQTFQGFNILNSNLKGSESNINVELLYRGLIDQSSQKITSLFN